MSRVLPLTCLAAAAALAATTAVAATAASPPGSAANPIRATTSATAGFSPRLVTVKPGAIVRFRNVDRARHNVVHDVVAGRPKFRSGPPTRGDFSVRAPLRPGRYDYVCSVHGFMRGVLVVKR